MSTLVNGLGLIKQEYGKSFFVKVCMYFIFYTVMRKRIFRVIVMFTSHKGGKTRDLSASSSV